MSGYDPDADFDPFAVVSVDLDAPALLSIHHHSLTETQAKRHLDTGQIGEERSSLSNDRLEGTPHRYAIWGHARIQEKVRSMRWRTEHLQIPPQIMDSDKVERWHRAKRAYRGEQNDGGRYDELADSMREATGAFCYWWSVDGDKFRDQYSATHGLMPAWRYQLEPMCSVHVTKLSDQRIFRTAAALGFDVIGVFRGSHTRLFSSRQDAEAYRDTLARPGHWRVRASLVVAFGVGISAYFSEEGLK